MFKIGSTQLWVHDQEAALEFWTQKVGFEVRTDVTVAELGNFRWLTVAAAGEDVEIVLMKIPGQPVMDDETHDRVRELTGKGFAGAIFLITDDCRGDFERLRSRGVEFSEEPTDRPYGIDAGFHDPSGNTVRLTQVKEIAAI
jgi:uncharacterized glyoxalase superfamily protein PhnB